jgi:uncharacterized ubiquitin-like protein YukD
MVDDIDYRDFETVGDLLEYVCKLKGWNPDNFRVTYRGMALRNDMKLADLKLEKGDKLVIVSKVVGCQKLKLEDREHNK